MHSWLYIRWSQLLFWSEFFSEWTLEQTAFLQMWVIFLREKRIYEFFVKKSRNYFVVNDLMQKYCFPKNLFELFVYSIMICFQEQMWIIHARNSKVIYSHFGNIKNIRGNLERQRKIEKNIVPKKCISIV